VGTNILGRKEGDLREQVGEVPRLAEVPTPFDADYSPQIGAGQGGRTTKSRGRLNLRAVADVLETYGLDPIEEVAKVLVKEEPALDARGNPILDEHGQAVMKPALPHDVRLRTLLELAQYARPKLKAVEITNKEPELTDEQVERRLQALLERRAQAKG
jgi:hypothetical protein